VAGGEEGGAGEEAIGDAGEEGGGEQGGGGEEGIEGARGVEGAGEEEQGAAGRWMRVSRARMKEGRERLQNHDQIQNSSGDL